jgi:hypothetical protein
MNQFGKMKKFLVFLFLLAIGSQAISQKIHFAYIQTESGQPFFVRMKDMSYSSTASGYLILSRLVDSTYTLHLGFPGDNKEQKFTVPIEHKDKGYLLKNFGEQGWGLFDLQEMTVQMSQNTAAVKTVPDENVSPFTEILSKAADDPSLKERTVIPVVAKKEEAIIPAVQKEELVVPVKNETEPEKAKTEPVVNSNSEPAKTELTKVEEKKQPVVKEEPMKIKEEPLAVKDESEPVKEEVVTRVETKNEDTRSGIIRHSSTTGTEGVDLVYLDKPVNGKTDTIRVFVPHNKPVVETRIEEKKEEPKDEKKFLDISMQPGDTTAKAAVKPDESEPKKEEVKTEPEPVKVEEKKEEVKEEPKRTVAPNACTETASESDFLKLRRRMVSEDDDDAMINEARKGFKAKCFTVYQIRNLGALFLTDEGRYRFFDAAYPYASDAHNFISLKLELKEGYWVRRFEAMLK